MSGSGSSARYEIRVDGVLDSTWTAWFEGFRLQHRGTDTVISCPAIDQAALHGVLAKVRDLGLGLVSVVRLDPGGSAPPSDHP